MPVSRRQCRADDVDVRWSRTGLERNHDNAMDGKRFLIIKREGEDTDAAQSRLDIVLNWFEGIRERVPVN